MVVKPFEWFGFYFLFKMARDLRRLQVPTDSESYQHFVLKDVKDYESTLREILDNNKIRKDGRTFEDQRKICKYLKILIHKKIFFF